MCVEKRLKVVLEKSQARIALEEEKRQRLTSGELGLDMYKNAPTAGKKRPEICLNCFTL